MSFTINNFTNFRQVIDLYNLSIKNGCSIEYNFEDNFIIEELLGEAILNDTISPTEDFTHSLRVQIFDDIYTVIDLLLDKFNFEKSNLDSFESDHPEYIQGEINIKKFNLDIKKILNFLREFENNSDKVNIFIKRVEDILL